MEDLFEAAVERCFGERLRRERAEGMDARKADHTDGDVFLYRHGIGARLWGSLANVDWKHSNGDTASYSFRAAGDMIAAIIGQGDYMDWYCSHAYEVIDPEIAERLGQEGWTAEIARASRV